MASLSNIVAFPVILLCQVRILFTETRLFYPNSLFELNYIHTVFVRLFGRLVGFSHD